MHKLSIRYSNRLFAEGLEHIISGLREFSLLSSCLISNDCENCTFIDPEASITIIELDFPKKSEVEFIKEQLMAHSTSHVLLISNQASVQISSELISCGISGYLLKRCGKSDLVGAFNKILDGKEYFCTDITKRIVLANKVGKENGNNNLSDREKEILSLFANNLSIHEVASHLNISENTVKTHKKNILSKLGLQNSLSLFLYAVRNELVEAGDHDLCNRCPYFSEN